MAENKCKLTNRRVTDLENENGQPLWIYDTDTPGFAVTVSPLGKKCFYFVGRVRGKPTRIKLGTFPGLSTEAARKAARGHIGDVAMGKDIVERKRQGRATVADLWGHYFETWARPRKRTWERDLKEWERMLKPEFGHVPVTHIERSDVERLVIHLERERGRGAARKARSLLSKMFEVGIADGWCQHNPVRKTYRPDFEPRQRYLKLEEVESFMAAVDSLKNQTARDFIKLLLYTGARRGNVCSMRWDELDLSAKLWVIPAAKYKGKKPHVVPLSKLAMEILKGRHDERNGSPWVFPSGSQAGHYTDPKWAWASVCERAGIENLRLHDLRRSLGAWQQRNGASLRTIQQTLGHSNVSVTQQYYSPMEVDQVRTSVDDALAAMLGKISRTKK